MMNWHKILLIFDSIIRDDDNKLFITGSYETIKLTVLSLINAPGALQFFKRGMFIRGKFSMQKCSV